MVDGGYAKATVLQWLRRQGITTLDRVVASHPQQDHMGGLLAVLDGIDVDELWLSEKQGFDALVEKADHKDVAVMYPVDLGMQQPHTGTNDRSLVVQIGHHVLLTGDIEAAGESLWVSHSSPQTIPLLKVPHHGSKTSSSGEFLDHICPQVAVISAGLNNRYGHPSSEVLSRYRERGITVYRTDLDGTVQVRFNKQNMSVRTHRGGVGWSDWTHHLIDDEPCARLAPIKSTTHFL